MTLTNMVPFMKPTLDDYPPLNQPFTPCKHRKLRNLQVKKPKTLKFMEPITLS